MKLSGAGVRSINSASGSLGQFQIEFFSTQKIFLDDENFSEDLQTSMNVDLRCIDHCR